MPAIGMVSQVHVPCFSHNRHVLLSSWPRCPLLSHEDLIPVAISNHISISVIVQSYPCLPLRTLIPNEYAAAQFQFYTFEIWNLPLRIGPSHVYHVMT